MFKKEYLNFSKCFRVIVSLKKNEIIQFSLPALILIFNKNKTQSCQFYTYCWNTSGTVDIFAFETSKCSG